MKIYRTKLLIAFEWLRYATILAALINEKMMMVLLVITTIVGILEFISFRRELSKKDAQKLLTNSLS